MNKRIEKLLSLMKEASIDNIIITDPKNMHYYSGFYNGEGYLIVGRAGLMLVTDSRYTLYAKSLENGFDICDISKNKVSDFVNPSHTLAFEDEYMTYSDYTALNALCKNLVPSGAISKKPRLTKDKTEIDFIKKAAHIADLAFDYICDYIKEGKTEKEIADQIDWFMKRNGAIASSFETIVASGKRGALPHAHPTDKPLSDGELVVMDFGCVYEGYMSDMTRTVAIGNTDDENKRIYETVLTAQKSALSYIGPGKKASETDKVARDIINKDYPGLFSHSLGHGVGLDIHESPTLSPKSCHILEVGNVVTIEPGIYDEKRCGVRIEDLVVITEDGIENLTQSPKELICI